MSAYSCIELDLLLTLQEVLLTYSHCASAALSIQYAKLTSRTVFSSGPCMYNICPHYLINDMTFGTKRTFWP